jgi:hypothetical protein
MKKVKFLYNVTFEGNAYNAGEVYALEDKKASALGNSVEVVGTIKEEKASAKPPVDKMLKKSERK